MNKLAIALSAALSLGAVASASAQDATITFNGNITAAACAINIGGDASSSTVTMRTVTAEGLKTTNPGHRNFTVTVGDSTVAGCPGNTAELILDTANVNPLTGNLINRHVNPGDPNPDPAAAGVEVRILDESGTAINLASDTIEAAKGSDNNFTYKFQAIYHVADHGVVTAGKFASALPFIVSHY
ncbi:MULTISPECIES: type 1 fimbrial protein [Stenotrophomonas]|uniref:fimbrial protein n=1 Tax=Stenotrophomonas TaxID=40323 RepID=UPI0015DDEC24|nr:MULTISPECIES: type 1 fimbrial protein [Stenotrophomonas]MBA0428736.1 type 1 fimbrial protein [Stenotrophomonas maltophilia]MDH0273593.1 type 1 fimbrial protein [Stenotrophomonas sp. GD04089]MDH1910440.1 type 1 fimbrial protein [Stenotrophomonas sp. GD03794]